MIYKLIWVHYSSDSLEERKLFSLRLEEKIFLGMEEKIVLGMEENKVLGSGGK